MAIPLLHSLQIAIDARGAKAGAKQYSDSTKGIGRDSAKADKAISQVDKGMKTLKTTSTALKSTLGSVFAGLGTAMLVRNATNTIADFQQTISELQTVSNATNTELMALTETARNLGATTRFSATEAGKAMVNLARMGFDANESLEAVEHTLNLAVAQVMDLDEAARITASGIRQFRLETSDAEQVVDALQFTSNNAGTNVMQLGEALKLVGPVAGALEYTVGDTAAALGVLGDNAITGSLAGTNLRGIIAGLLAPTDAAKEAIKGMGLSIEELNPATHSIIEVMRTLADANLSTADATTIFGRRNFAAALALTGSIEKLEDMASEMENLQDITKDAAAVMDDNLKGALLGLRSAWEELNLATGDRGFSGFMRTTVEVLTDAVRILSGMEGAIEASSAAGRVLADTLQVIIVLFGIWISMKAVLFITSLASGVVALSKAMIGLEAAAGSQVVIFAAMGKALLALTAIVAAFELGRWLREEFQIVQEGAAKVAQVIQDTLVTLKLTFRLIVASIKLAFVGLIDLILEGLGSLLKRVGSTLNAIESAINKIPWIDNVSLGASSITAAGTGLGNIFDTEDIKQDMKDYVREATAEYKVNRQAFEDAMVEIEKEFTNRPETTSYMKSFIDFVKKDIDSIKTEFGEMFERPDLSGLEEMQDEFKQALEETSSIFEAWKATQPIDFSKIEVRIPDWQESVSQDLQATFRSLRAQNELSASTKDIRAVNREIKETQVISEGAADAFGDFVGDLASGSSSAADSVLNLVEAIKDLVIQLLIVKPLQDAVTSYFKAPSIDTTDTSAVTNSTGNVYDRGNLVKFATGGVVTTPTLFPIGSRTGIMGEAGPEAIMPLTRGPGGSLGVSAENIAPTETNLKVELINQTDQQVEIEQREPKFDGENLVIGIVMKNLANNGSIRQFLRTNK